MPLAVQEWTDLPTFGGAAMENVHPVGSAEILQPFSINGMENIHHCTAFSITIKAPWFAITAQSIRITALSIAIKAQSNAITMIKAWRGGGHCAVMAPPL